MRAKRLHNGKVFCCMKRAFSSNCLKVRNLLDTPFGGYIVLVELGQQQRDTE